VSTHCCDGATGSLHAQVFIRNASRQACLLVAVPKVKSLDGSGQQLPVALEANADLDQYEKGRVGLCSGQDAKRP
jgi:hypothetical protein